MRVTIIRSDNMVYVNGIPLQVDCSTINPNIRAIQWYNNHGFIEYEDNSEDHIVDISPFQSYIDAWQTAYDVITTPEIPTLSEAIDSVVNQAFHYMNNLLEESTVYVDISSGANTPFGCDTFSRENIIGINTAISIGLPVPNPRAWTPKGSLTPVDVTHQDFAIIGGAMIQKKDDLYQVYANHKSAIKALQTVEDVLSYDYTTGY